jgi:hypothetical protein
MIGFLTLPDPSTGAHERRPLTNFLEPFRSYATALFTRS